MLVNLSIVIPLFNEEETLPFLYQRISNILPELKKYLLGDSLRGSGEKIEVLFVNDGSSDKTQSILEDIVKKDNTCRYLSLSRNFGHQPAISAGLLAARGKAVVIMDGDLQDPPELIKDMISKWKEGFDVVCATRRKRKGFFLKNISYKLYYKLNMLISDFPVQRDAGDFSLLDRRVVDVINNLPEKERYVRGLRAWVGFRQTEIPCDRMERKKGKSKYGIFSLVRLAFHGILSTSVKPLFLSGLFCSLSTLIIFGVILFSFIAKVFLPENAMPKGWTSIMVTVSVLSLLQLISIWLLSLYIARIYREIISRPAYVVAYDSLNKEAIEK